jgi:hypothetical protein
MVSRRVALYWLGSTPIMERLLLSPGRLLAQMVEQNHVPVRALTKGPRFHWFGYYDKWEFDLTDRYVLGNEVTFEGRTPQDTDPIRVGMVDTQDGDRWIDLGESHAWCWQQGCMLQWLPGSDSEVIWNDRESDAYVAHILDVKTGKKRTIGMPVYAINPDGTAAVHADFARVHDTRPGYGYAGIPDPEPNIAAPKNSGLWKVDLVQGTQKMLYSFAEIQELDDHISNLRGHKQWINHMLWSPSGRKFCFLHRWELTKPNGDINGPFGTRLITANADGSNLYVLDPYGQTSHFYWRDDEHILAWSWHPSYGDGFYLYEDGTRNVGPIGRGVMDENGHCTYLPGNQWILNDTYQDLEDYQHPYLYQVATGRKYPLGAFRSPPEYHDEFRCDTHPRHSRNGRKVVIDSPHGGNGRQIYLLDISGIIGGSQ